jgi:hypothetical protein
VRHQEADGACPRVLVLGCSAGALTLNETCHLSVEVKLGTIDLEIDRVRDTSGEYWLSRPRAIRTPLGEIDHSLLGAAQVEGRAPTIHSFSDRPYIGVGIRIEELQE